MKRGGFLKRTKPLRSKSYISAGTTPGFRLRARHPSDTNVIKDEIQALLRAIVIERDGGCILRHTPQAGPCNGFRKDGNLVLQADHLVTRANAATYADARLVVCLCQGHHGGFKKWNEKQYDALIRTLISPDRVQLWDRAHAARYQPTRKTTYDWKLELAALKQELARLKTH